MKVYFILFNLVIIVYSNFNDLERIIFNSTNYFVLNLINITNSTISYPIQQDSIKSIYLNSFQLDNNFGGYYDCLKNNNMTYLYYLFIENNYLDARNESLGDYYKELIFYYYKSFAMCLPEGIKFEDNITFTNINNKKYVLRVYNLKNLNEESVKKPLKFSFYVLITIFCIFIIFSIYFAIFPDYQEFINLFKKRALSISSEEICLNPVNGIVYDKKGSLYYLFSSIFNITKNINRLFKPTKKKISLHTCYINDNSISFTNGFRGINLLCLSFCVVFWIIMISPSVLNNKDSLQIIFNDPIILPIINYLYISLYINFSINSFILSYKFLCHISNDNMNNNISIKYKIFSFIFPLTYKYIVYVFLMFFLLNFRDILYTFTNKTCGPFSYLFEEMICYSYDNLYELIIPIGNLTIDFLDLRKNSLFVFFYVFINEIQYFLILILILIIYLKNSRCGYSILIILYLIIISIRTTIFVLNTYDIRSVIGYDISNYRFLYGISVYLMGGFFGILFYEYNSETFKPSIFIDKSLSSDYEYSNISIRTLPYSNFIKKIGRSNIIQNIILIVNIIVLYMAIFYDFYVLFPKIRQNNLYEFSSFEKFISFLELDIITLLVFSLIWKFVIFQNSFLKRLLESSFWLPLSRSYFIASCIICPITYYMILSINYPITFSIKYVIFLTFSVLIILLVLSFLINLIFEVPIKVGFKKLFAKKINN